MLQCSFSLAAAQLLVKMTSALQKSQCCRATSAALHSENCSATSVFACGMLQGWGLEGWGLELADWNGLSGHCKTHSKPPSKTPFGEPLPRTFSEPFLEAWCCTVVRSPKRAPNTKPAKNLLFSGTKESWNGEGSNEHSHQQLRKIEGPTHEILGFRGTKGQKFTRTSPRTSP